MIRKCVIKIFQIEKRLTWIAFIRVHKILILILIFVNNQTVNIFETQTRTQSKSQFD